MITLLINANLHMANYYFSNLFFNLIHTKFNNIFNKKMANNFTALVHAVGCTFLAGNYLREKTDSNYDMLKVYKSIDIVVLPSWREGLSKSLLEASAMGLPIITTDVPGCNDIVEHGKSGLLVPLNNPISIKLAILFLINNPYIAQKFGENARLSTTKNFNSEIVLSQTMSLYEKP